MPVPRSAIPERPFIRRVTEAEYTSIQQAEKARVEAEREQNREPLLSLAAHIQSVWQAAQRAKVDVEQTLLQCARQRNGEYDPSVLAELREEGDTDPIYMLLTNIKCRAAESWLRDVELPPGDKPWAITHTPVPDLPEHLQAQIVQQVETELTQYMMQFGFDALTPDMVQERMEEIEAEIKKREIEAAKKDAESLETLIDDELTEGGFYQAIGSFISDLTTYPAAFLKGPIVRKKKALTWTTNRAGETVPAIAEKFTRNYCAPSPYDIYPSPGARNIQDGPLVERIRLRRSDLESCIGVEGFSGSAIQGVLQLYGEGGLENWLGIDQERADVEGRSNVHDDPDPPIEALEFWGAAQGRKLLEWGMDRKTVPDANKDYAVTAWLVGHFVVMARINPHPLGKRPYYSTAYEKINNQIWGKCPPILMRDVQRICNAVARAMVRNMGFASGPQAEISTDRVDPGEDIENVYPLKVWKTKDPMGTGRPAVNFFQPDPLTEILLRVYEYFFLQASEQTGIPQYIYGAEEGVKGAGKTASGLGMLMNAATKTLRGVIFHIDDDVIRPAIMEHWLHVMLYDKHIPKKGDINVVVRASEYLIIAEQLQLRLTEYLRETNNPADLEIMGLEGRAALHRAAVKNLKLPEEVIPTAAELEQRRIVAERQAAAMEVGPPPQGKKGASVDAAGGRSGEQVRMNR